MQHIYCIYRNIDQYIFNYYEEKDWIENPQATTTENVNPFNVIAFHGVVHLDPPSDNWARTIYIDNVRTESTGNTWVESSNIVSQTSTTETDVEHFDETNGFQETGYYGTYNTITTIRVVKDVIIVLLKL